MTTAMLCIVTSAYGAVVAAPPTRLSGTEFARALGAVKEGMAPADVEKLLGTPDDVREKKDLPYFLSEHYGRAWCYGTDRHLGFAMRGMVIFDEAGPVFRVYGQGNPVPAGMFADAELRRLLELIDRAPDFDAAGYDPLPVIQITNALQPLGKRKALAALTEYLRLAPDWTEARHGVFLVLRTLFDVPVPPGYMPPMFVGQPSPAKPKDPRTLPRFPIAILDDVPINLVNGYMLFGSEEAVEAHVEYFEKHGVLRAAPLKPTDRPLKLLDAMRRAPWWAGYGDDRRMTIQVLRLVQPVFGLERVDWRFSDKDPGTVLADVLKRHGDTKLRWDPKTNTYQRTGS